MTVAVLAFAAGALVVWLVVFAGRTHVPETAPLEPTKGAVASVSSAADKSTSAAPTTNADVAASTSIPTDSMRQAKAERRTTCVLGGYVRSSEESPHPIAHAWVGLFHTALQEDDPTSQFGQWGGPPERYAKWRQLLTYSYSDDDGKFSFDELQAGTYVVHVEYGPLVTASTAPQTLAPGEVRGGLDIALPLAGALAGQILAPPDTSFEGWRVALEPVDRQQMHAMAIEGRIDNSLVKNVGDDGSFELGPSEAGLHRVLLLRAGHARFTQDVGLPIGEVMIVAGQTVQQTFDLREGFPGSMNVTLHVPAYEVDEETALQNRTYYMIVATPLFRGAKFETVQAGCLIGETVVVGPLEPGMWSVGVRSMKWEWTWKSPIEQRIDAGQARDVSVEVLLYTGTLTCVDFATGAALGDTDVMISSNDNGSGCKTDAQGRVRLQYPVGRYSVYPFDQANFNFDDSGSDLFEWQEDGPHPSTVKLPRPVKSPH